MKRVTRYLFMSATVLTLLIGLAQAASQPLIGYCDQVCCESGLCHETLTYCWCPNVQLAVNCAGYCAGWCQVPPLCGS
jgi:hypothetical protein